MKLKHLVIAVAATMSTTAAYAAPGDLVTGGDGTVTIGGTITSSSCSVSVTGESQSFNISDEAIKNANNGDVIATAASTFNVNNCQGTPLDVTATGTPDGTDNLFNSFDEGPGSVIGISYQLKVDDMNHWLWPNGNPVTGELIFPNDNTFRTYTAPTNAASFIINTNVRRSSGNSIPSTVNATYQYRVVYH